MTSTITGEPAPPTTTTPPAELVPGDQVNAWAQEVLHYSGTVEIIAAELGFIWIREDGINGIGAHRLLDVRQHQIHRQDPPAAPPAQ